MKRMGSGQVVNREEHENEANTSACRVVAFGENGDCAGYAFAGGGGSSDKRFFPIRQ
jgi:hypothetical protein